VTLAPLAGRGRHHQSQSFLVWRASAPTTMKDNHPSRVKRLQWSCYSFVPSPNHVKPVHEDEGKRRSKGAAGGQLCRLMFPGPPNLGRRCTRSNPGSSRLTGVWLYTKDSNFRTVSCGRREVQMMLIARSGATSPSALKSVPLLLLPHTPTLWFPGL
jgi:hypothetical protein